MLAPHIKDKLPYDGKPNIGDKLVYKGWSYETCEDSHYTVVKYNSHEVVVRQSMYEYTHSHLVFMGEGWYYWNRYFFKEPTGFGKFIRKIEDVSL